MDNSSKIIQTNACQNKTVLGVWIAYILMKSGNAAVFTNTFCMTSKYQSHSEDQSMTLLEETENTDIHMTARAQFK